MHTRDRVTAGPGQGGGTGSGHPVPAAGGGWPRAQRRPPGAGGAGEMPRPGSWPPARPQTPLPSILPALRRRFLRQRSWERGTTGAEEGGALGVTQTLGRPCSPGHTVRKNVGQWMGLCCLISPAVSLSSFLGTTPGVLTPGPPRLAWAHRRPPASPPWAHPAHLRPSVTDVPTRHLQVGSCRVFQSPPSWNIPGPHAPPRALPGSP